MEPVKEEHPSYGMLQINHVSGGDMILYGSPIKHNHKVCLRITRGSCRRELNQQWYYGGQELIEVEMSPVQFAEAFSTPNRGCGTPCTLRRVAGERMPDTPALDNRQLIEDEFQATMTKMARDFFADTKAVKAILEKKSLNKEDRNAITDCITKVAKKLASTLPFIHAQFNEAMTDTVHACKGEMEAFLAQMTKIHQQGGTPSIPNISIPAAIQIESRPDGSQVWELKEDEIENMPREMPQP